MLDPVIEGVIVKCLADIAQALFKDVSDSGIVQKNKGWLEPMSVVLSVLVALLNLILSGGTLTIAEITPVLLNILQVFIGTKVAGTETLKGLAVKCRTKILSPQ